MLATYSILIACLIGHLIHTILFVNITHGYALKATWMGRAVFAVAGVAGLAAILVAWWLSATSWLDWPLMAKGYSLVCLGTSVLGLPAVTIARAMRRTPDEAKRIRSETMDLASRFGADSLTGRSARSFLLRIPGNSAFRLRLSEWALTIDDLPRALEGLSVLHLTDLHFAPSYSRRFFEEIVDLTIADGPMPDLVVITGDFLDDNEALPWIVPMLSRLKGRLGQFAILGNHDYHNDFKGLRRELRAAGFKTLEGRWPVLAVGGTRLAIGGTSHPWGKDLGLRDVPSADTRILLSHSPDEVYKAAAWGIDVMFCGHNHGGQVRLPVLGPILTPSRYSRRFDRGIFRVGRILMCVSEGIAAKDPIRIGCVPEVTRFVLKTRVPGFGAREGEKNATIIQVAHS